jgi:hypothetical protein
MLMVDLTRRITLEEILAHPWILALDGDQIPAVDLGEEFRYCTTLCRVVLY